MTTVILDALPSERYSVIKQQTIRDPDLSLVDVEHMMRTIYVNHVEKSSASRESSLERRENVWGSAMNTTGGFRGFRHYCRERRHKISDCDQRKKKQNNEGSPRDREKPKWCSVHKTVGRNDTECYAK